MSRACSGCPDGCPTDRREAVTARALGRAFVLPAAVLIATQILLAPVAGEVAALGAGALLVWLVLPRRRR